MQHADLIHFHIAYDFYHCSCCSVTKLCPILRDHMDCSTPGFPFLHHLWSLLRLMSVKSVMLSSHFILCRPLLLLPPVPPSIRVFSNESTLCMRWPKYWSFSFSNKVFLRCKKKPYQTSSVNKILKEKEKTQVNI